MTTTAAIDIGYGNTKICYQTRKDDAPKTRVFRSIIAPAHTRTAPLAGTLGQRDTRLVQVDGAAYEVGPDADSLVSSRNIRVLHERYIHSTQYRALFLGALSYIGQNKIDMLVTGLPVHLLESDRAALEKMLLQDHQVDGLGPVTIERVKIIPQPVGGLYAHLTDQKVRSIQGHRRATLLIDPGFFTLDWAGIKGNTPQENLTGSSPTGFSVALSAAADVIGDMLGRPFDNLDLLDEKLRGDELRIAGKRIDRDKVNVAISSALRPALLGMHNQLGDGDLFDEIILAGGAGSYYEPIVKELWPDHPTYLLDDPVTANVRGFHNLASTVAQLFKKGEVA